MRTRRIVVASVLGLALLTSGCARDVTFAAEAPSVEAPPVECEAAYEHVAATSSEIERLQAESRAREQELREMVEQSADDRQALDAAQAELAAEPARLATTLSGPHFEWATAIVDNAVCFTIRDRVEASAYID